MRLPNADNAIIGQLKARDYLLDPDHEDGKSKARFFRALGFTRGQWQELEASIRSQHLELDASEDGANRHAKFYRIVGPLQGPSGTATIRSVWIIRHGEDFPRLVSAYPEKK